MMMYEQFNRTKNLITETEFVKIYQCTVNDQEYKIIFTKERANQRTAIQCVDNCIGWEQRPLITRNSGYRPGEYVPVYQFSEDQRGTTLFVVRGNPRVIEGLDEGIFRSANRLASGYVNVMSFGRFKEL